MSLRTQCEERVLRHARKLARMRAHGSYVEHDGVVLVNHHESVDHEEAVPMPLTT